MYLLSSSDRIMISNLVNDSATAYYTVAYSVASIALIIWNAVNSSLVPFTYEMPQGLFCVKGEILIERQIELLKEDVVEEILTWII